MVLLEVEEDRGGEEWCLFAFKGSDITILLGMTVHKRFREEIL